jgi:hypothetical protein
MRPRQSPRDVVSPPAKHFRVVSEAFERAADAAGSVERFYNLGGCSIKLRFAGHALAERLTPALAHRAVERGGGSDLEICLWDTASTGVELPPPSWGGDAYGAQGAIRGFNDSRYCTNVWLGDERWHFAAFNMLDQQSGKALYWIPDAADFPFAERSAPLRMILNWWVGRRGGQVLHAGAVGRAQGGVLFAGKGGSGKSTTALACLWSELSYASDDYCLVDFGETPRAHSLYCSAKLCADSLQRLAGLTPYVSNRERPAGEKAVIFLDQPFGDKLIESFPIRAIVLPRVRNLPETTLTEVAGAAALTALAPSTIFQLPGNGAQAFRLLAGLVRRTPTYELALGADISRVPSVVENLLSELES